MKYILFQLKESFGSLRSNLLRSILTVVGIVVGIFAVTSMLAMGEGISKNVMDSFSSMGSGDVSVYGSSLTTRDFEWIKEKKFVKNITGMNHIYDARVTSGAHEYSPTITATRGDFSEMNNIKPTQGELFDFNNEELGDRVALITKVFSGSVERNGATVSIGDTLMINGKDFRIVGEIEFGMSFYGDGTIFIPYKAMRENFLSSDSLSEILLNLKNNKAHEVITSYLQTSLNSMRSNNDDVWVNSSTQFIEEIQRVTGMLNLFLVIIGGISLFVGGIGTMNMMLTTVTERTKEIGLRKAIGARDKDILVQILLESTMITLLGGIIGIVFSYIGAAIANNIIPPDAGISLIVSSRVLVMSVVVSIAIGIIFGFYPARNASKLQPVDALRSE